MAKGNSTGDEFGVKSVQNKTQEIVRDLGIVMAASQAEHAPYDVIRCSWFMTAQCLRIRQFPNKKITARAQETPAWGQPVQPQALGRAMFHVDPSLTIKLLDPTIFDPYH